MVILIWVFDRAIDTGKIVTRFVDIPICNNGISINIFYVINNCISDRGISWLIVIALHVKSRIRRGTPGILSKISRIGISKT